MDKRQRDNSTLTLKASLRRSLMNEIGQVVIMETHGGYGHVYDLCYQAVERGIVFEKDAKKAAFLAQQRPSWAVYECSCEEALAAGVGGHLPVNMVDIDPYGEPWPTLDAFLIGHGERMPSTWGLVVNDGLRGKVAATGGWDVDSLMDAVAHWGAAAMHNNYLDVCRWLVDKKVATVGFTVARWAGYYCGRNQAMTHYAAIMRQC